MKDGITAIRFPYRNMEDINILHDVENTLKVSYIVNGEEHSKLVTMDLLEDQDILTKERVEKLFNILAP